MISVKHINKKFGKATILENVSFQIEEGDYLAVMGPSGAGKSTLLYSVSGMDSIDEGEVFFDEQNIVKLTENQLAKIRLEKMGFVFQNPEMLKNLSILDNIMLSALVMGKEEPEKIRSRAINLLKEMGIKEIADRDIQEVSGGQLQRASICRAMINQPRILFLDEPTGALNSEATNQILDILHSLNKKGMTILLVTHDPRVAACAGKTLYIRDGGIAGWKEFGGSTTAEDNGKRERELAHWLYTVKEA